MEFMIPPPTEEWPEAVERKYERIEILGKGSFGMVWMARRVTPPDNEYDDEYVAIKSIQIKNEKGKVYAEREIRILQELKHPNVIRLIAAYPIYEQNRIVVMQLARGPNLHQLVMKRGALGLPLCRLLSRQLIAAVSYIHGRGVLHRDIKPSNCILALNNHIEEDYDWYIDKAIWSSGQDGIDAVKNEKWKVMLVDFGFARALEKEEITEQTKHLRNSILFEGKGRKEKAKERSAIQPSSLHQPPPNQYETPSSDSSPEERSSGQSYQPRSMYPSVIPEVVNDEDEDRSIADDMMKLEEIVNVAADGMRHSYFEATNVEEDKIMGVGEQSRTRKSYVSMVIPMEKEDSKPKKLSDKDRRISTARRHIRSMSALGTKAYAAPEIRKKLRQKNELDFEKANAAMTDCVADYGMIVDAYSVGWTLRVAMTGVPPNFTMSEYLRERDTAVLEGDDIDDELENNDSCCCCFEPIEIPFVRVRDPSMLPSAATLLITRMTEKDPENRMTVREAQNDPWIAGRADENDPPYTLPQGDIPSKHGDPVIPLECAAELSKLTVAYHMQ